MNSEILCPKCNIPLVENLVVTGREYNKSVDILYNKEGKLDIDNLPKYVVFVCKLCSHFEKITFEDYFKLRQEIAIKLVVDKRIENSITKLKREYSGKELREESGFGYCGICPGPFDGDGYCNKDLMSICATRREILEK